MDNDELAKALNAIVERLEALDADLRQMVDAWKADRAAQADRASRAAAAIAAAREPHYLNSRWPLLSGTGYDNKPHGPIPERSNRGNPS